MNVFDRMDDEEQEFEQSSNEGSFSVQFGTESAEVALRQGMTIREAFAMNADYLGFDVDRRLTIRDDLNNLLDGNQAPAPGRTYMASLMHDEKG